MQEHHVEHHHDTRQRDFWGQVKKKVSNVKAMTVVSSKNTKEMVKIQMAELKIIEVKKQFGVTYLDLLMNNEGDVLQLFQPLHLHHRSFLGRLISVLDRLILSIPKIPL